MTIGFLICVFHLIVLSACLLSVYVILLSVLLPTSLLAALFASYTWYSYQRDCRSFMWSYSRYIYRRACCISHLLHHPWYGLPVWVDPSSAILRVEHRDAEAHVSSECSADCVELSLALRSIVVDLASTIRDHLPVCPCLAAAWPSRSEESRFYETRPRLLGRPAERHISKLPHGLAVAVKKRTVAWIYVKIFEFMEFHETYTESSTDTMIRVVNGDIPAKAEAYCADGVEFLKCFGQFSQCMIAMFPHDKDMPHELSTYGSFIAAKYKTLHPAIVAKIDDVARVFAFKHHCAFWPLAPEVLAEIIALSSGNKVATCHICNLPGHFAANCRSASSAVSAKPPRGRGSARRTSQVSVNAALGAGPVASTAAVPPGPCRNWNIGAACAKSPCLYSHTCGACGTVGHILSQCPDKTKAATMTAVFRAKGRASR